MSGQKANNRRAMKSPAEAAEKRPDQRHDTLVKEKIQTLLAGGDILLIVPPFTGIHYPFYALHILKALALEKGYKTEILYLNTLLASILGEEFANAVSYSAQFAYWKMIGERLFARGAYGMPPLGKAPECCFDEAMSISGNKKNHINTTFEQETIDPETLKTMEAVCYSFIRETIPVIASFGYKMIGCTVRAGQVNAAVALLNGIKDQCPGIITLIGGSNCKGEMAEGIASLSDSIDYIFSGESEISFMNFLEGYSKGEMPAGRIIEGEPLEDLDTLPLPLYEDYIAQSEAFVGTNLSQPLAIAYETSRGCWWGQKHRCRFCGAPRERFRQKNAKTVLEDLEKLSIRYPGRRIEMVDNIMPYSFHKDLLPGLACKDHANIIYFLKANLKGKQLVRLKAAKIDLLVPGIEALSTGLLKLLNKGVTVRNNLFLLRYARSLGLYVYWHILWGIPGDKASHYRETLDLIPLIRHLQPPVGINHIQFKRSSVYLENPSHYRLEEVRPWAVYNMIYPQWADIEKLAFFYTGAYPCESHTHPELINELLREWELWEKTWRKTRLVMTAAGDSYIIYDNRETGGEYKRHRLEKEEAVPIMRTCIYDGSPRLQWALQEKLGVVVESWYVPLVTAAPSLLAEFEKQVD